ncbi:NRDE family protein [Desulfobacterales bacterium HSG16]|nr:NRDE family protein [Desulfobacterales bacterium HSG16]
MCLIIFSYDVHPVFELIIAANRDEFYQRPTAPLDSWKDAPHVYAGRDLERGGTWMGASTSGKIAAVTNFREPFQSLKTNALSRGDLVSDFIKGSKSPVSYLEQFKEGPGEKGLGKEHNGFNLIAGDRSGLFYCSNRHCSNRAAVQEAGSKSETKSEVIQKLKPGIYGVSNHLLNTPWPKVEQSKERFGKIIKSKKIDIEAIFTMLADQAFAPDDQLPDTGVGYEWEKMLSPVFIKSEIYGTRSSSVLLVTKNRQIQFVERTFVPGKKAETVEKNIMIRK